MCRKSLAGLRFSNTINELSVQTNAWLFRSLRNYMHGVTLHICNEIKENVCQGEFVVPWTRTSEERKKNGNSTRERSSSSSSEHLRSVHPLFDSLGYATLSISEVEKRDLRSANRIKKSDRSNPENVPLVGLHKITRMKRFLHGLERSFGNLSSNTRKSTTFHIIPRTPKYYNTLPG